MLFNSVSFIVFFPIVVLLYFAIPKKIRYLWLLAASYFFYMCWNAKYALLLFYSTAVTYISGLLIDRCDQKGQPRRRKKLFVALSFTLNLSLLFLFKYFDFVIENINLILAKCNLALLTPKFDLLLPVGISFYIFQALSYTMDVYRKEIYVEKNFLKYALFVSFFPQLVAGPIERSKHLLVQIGRQTSFSYENFRRGLLLMLWGYFQKIVIADRIGLLVDTVYGNVGQYEGCYFLLASVLFAIQIYCDFSGYSLIAVGAAKVMGFTLMENFNCPYFAQSVAEFPYFLVPGLPLYPPGGQPQRDSPQVPECAASVFGKRPMAWRAVDLCGLGRTERPIPGGWRHAGALLGEAGQAAGGKGKEFWPSLPEDSSNLCPGRFCLDFFPCREHAGCELHDPEHFYGA